MRDGDRDPGSASSTRSRLTWALLVGALLATLTSAAFAVAFMRQSADSSRDEELAFWQAIAAMDRLSALEWQAIGEGEVTDELHESVIDARTDLQASLRDFESPGSASEEGRLFAMASEYARLVLDEIVAVESGDIETARQIDEEQVDPLYEGLRPAFVEEAQAHSTSSGRDAVIAGLTTLVAILTTSALSIALVRRPGATGTGDGGASSATPAPRSAQDYANPA